MAKMKQEKEEKAAAAKEEEVRKKREDAKLAEMRERGHKYIGYVFGAALMLSTGWPDRQTETTT